MGHASRKTLPSCAGYGIVLLAVYKKERGCGKMSALEIFVGTVLLLVAFDEVARRRWPEVRVKVLMYLGALYPRHRN